MPRLTKAATVAEHRRNVLDRIYEAFETLIYERGYATVTLADIAHQADMSRTAIYNYFTDKETLLLQYTSREMDEYLSKLRVELARAHDPFGQLDVYVRSQVTYVNTHHLPAGPALTSVLPADAYDSMRHHGVILEDTLRTILGDAAAAGLIPARVADNPYTIRLVQSCLMSTHGRLLRGKALRDAVSSTQDFVRRAIGATER